MFDGLLKIGILVKGSELKQSYDYFAFERLIIEQMKKFYNSAKLIHNLKREMDQYKEEETDYLNM